MSENELYQNKTVKRLGCLVICVMLASCTKTIDDVHFHGRITLDCNSQFPAGNVKVFIKRYYDRGVHDADDIGTAITDNDGYYSLIADVKQTGTFEHYGLFVSATQTSSFPEFNCTAESSNNSDNVEINCEAHLVKAYGFHIKNVSPFNTSDIFNSLIVSWNNDAFHDTVAANLIGTTVDTTIYLLNDAQINYKYSFTKNSVQTTSQDSIILNPNCIDTLSINVFY